MRVFKAYLDGAHLSHRFIKLSSLCHFLNDDLFGLAAFVVRLIEKGDLGAGDKCLSVDGVTRMDEDTRTRCEEGRSGEEVWMY